MSSARSILTYVVPVLLIAAGIVYVAMDIGAKSPPTPAVQSADSAVAEPAFADENPDDRDEALLQQQIDDLRAQLVALANEQNSEEEPVAPQAAEPVDQAARWQEQKNSLDEIANSEEVDHSWASGAEATLASSFSAAAAPSLSLGEVTCRSSMCKMQMTADINDEQAIIKSFERFQPWEGGQVLLTLDPETGMGEVYVARAGSVLPGTTTTIDSATGG